MLPICNIRLKVKKPSYLPLPAIDDPTLGAELKRRRLVLEWTQQDSANYFEVLKDSYQKWGWNEVVPNIKRRKEANQFLGFNFWNDGSDSLRNRILLYRIEHRLYRTELAKLAEVSDSTIERIEKNIEVVSTELKAKVNTFISMLAN